MPPAQKIKERHVLPGFFLLVPVISALRPDTKHFISRVAEIQWG